MSGVHYTLMLPIIPRIVKVSTFVLLFPHVVGTLSFLPNAE